MRKLVLFSIIALFMFPIIGCASILRSVEKALVTPGWSVPREKYEEAVRQTYEDKWHPVDLENKGIDPSYLDLQFPVNRYYDPNRRTNALQQAPFKMHIEFAPGERVDGTLFPCLLVAKAKVGSLLYRCPNEFTLDTRHSELEVLFGKGIDVTPRGVARPIACFSHPVEQIPSDWTIVNIFPGVVALRWTEKGDEYTVEEIVTPMSYTRKVHYSLHPREVLITDNNSETVTFKPGRYVVTFFFNGKKQGDQIILVRGDGKIYNDEGQILDRVITAPVHGVRSNATIKLTNPYESR
jgi:hypothetical protein